MSELTVWVFVDHFNVARKLTLSSNQFVSDLEDYILKHYTSGEQCSLQTIEIWKLAGSVKLLPIDDCRERVLADKKNRLFPQMSISTVLSSIIDAFQVFVTWKPSLKRSLSEWDERDSKRFHSAEEESYKQAVANGKAAKSPSNAIKLPDLREQQRDYPVLNGRPDGGPPIAIYHEVFGRFQDSLSDDSSIPSPDIYRLVHMLFAFSAQIYDDDDARYKAVMPILSKLLQSPFQKFVHKDKAAADGSVVVTFCFGDVKIGCGLCIVELKNEIGTGDGDPSLQAGFTCRKAWIEESLQKLRDQCCCPTFLVAIAGPHIMVSGSVFSDKFIVQPLTPFLPLYAQRLEEYHQVHLVAKVFFALRTGLANLTEYYLTLPYAPLTLPLPSRYFPYIPKLVNVQGFKFDHRLISQDPTRAIFAARDANGRELIVKYVKSYGEEAHRLLAPKGLAPELLQCCDIPGGLKMVIMDCIQGQDVAEMYPGKIPRTIVAEIGTAIEILHREGYVFGDLRRVNVVVCDGHAMLIDFDGCDKEGQARYSLLNPDVKEWHTDASAGQLIQKEHDIHMLALLEKDSE